MNFTHQRNEFRDSIIDKASELGCLNKIDNMPDIRAVKFIQEREGFSSCFGEASPLHVSSYDPTECCEQNCRWLRPCNNYRDKHVVPIDKEFTDLNYQELQLFCSQILESNSKKTLKFDGVGMLIRGFDYEHISSIARKMLIATPKTIIGENVTENKSLRAFLISHKSSRDGWSGHLIVDNNLEIMFTSNPRELKRLLWNAQKFIQNTNLSYFPLVETLQYRDELGKGFNGMNVQGASLASFPKEFHLNTFNAQHVGLPDGEVMLTDPNFAPIINLELPVVENSSFDVLYKLMSDYPEELCSFRDYLQGKVEEVRSAAVGSEEFYKDCHKIERDIRDHIRKMNSDYKKNKITSSIALIGGVVASWTLALYCITKGSNDLLTILGPGGLAFTVAASYSDYLIKNLGLKDDPAYLIWLLGKTKKK